jgi:hypothetical protein
VSWARVVSGPAVSTKFPFAVHRAADTRTLAWAAEEIRASLQTGTRVAGRAEATPLRVSSAEWERVIMRLGLEAGGWTLAEALAATAAKEGVQGAAAWGAALGGWALGRGLAGSRRAAAGGCEGGRGGEGAGFGTGALASFMTASWTVDASPTGGEALGGGC